MKRILTVLFLMITIYGFGQVPSNYLNIRSRYNLIAIKSDSGFHVPGYSTIPHIRGGTWPGAGNVGVDTVNHKFYFYSGGSWREAGATYTFTNGITESGGTVKLGGTLTDEYTRIFGKYNATDSVLFLLAKDEIIAGMYADGQSINQRSSIVASPSSAMLYSGDNNADTSSTISVNKLNIQILPNLGNFYIDSLNATLSTTGKKLMLRDTATGLVQNIDPALIGGSTDTSSLSNRINLKLNIIDTANMRVRLAAGANVTLTGTYPNISIAATGGGTPSLTSTQIAYGDGSNAMTSDANFTRITNGIHVESDVTTQLRGVVVTNYANAVNAGSIMLGHARGTKASPSQILWDNALGSIAWRGYTSSGWDANDHQAVFSARASQDYTSANQGNYFTFELTPDNTNTIGEKMRLTGNGRLGVMNNNPSYTVDVTGTIVQRPTAAANTNNYLRTNAANSASTTDLNPGILFYQNTDNQWGIDLGYNSTTSRFRQRAFAISGGDFSFSSITAAPTGQSSFTELVTIRGDNGRVGIGTPIPASILHTVGTVRHETLGTASADTTSNKPVGINSSGDIIPMAYWPGSGDMSIYTRQQDTVTQASFGAGSGVVGDTTAFNTSTIYGSFFWDGSDTLVITKVKAVMNGGTSDTLGYNIYYNDTINVVGSTFFIATEPVTSTTTGAEANADNYINGSPPIKIPPGNWVWLKTPTVVTARKPYYFSVSIIGYKIRVY